MLDKEQFFMAKIAEECMEVAQRALKLSQFGIDEVQSGQDKTNGERLSDELDDLIGVLTAANNADVFTYEPNTTAVIAKRDKLEKYYKLSLSLGKVEDKPLFEGR